LAKVSIAIEDVTVRFGPNTALGGVSLVIEPGELLLLLGPSGCGKSTLLRSVAGFVTPESGRVLFDGEDVTTVSPDQRQIGMVFQSFALFPHLSVGENVAFGLRERKVPRAEIPARVEQALSDVRMKDFEKRRVDQLSGGEQQRVALARALVTRPRCLLLDEPLSNLDASLRQSMREEIRRVCKQHGLTTLYVTHDQKEALAIADRIAVLRAGKIVQLGPPHEVYSRPNSASVATFLGETNLLDAEIVGQEGGTTRLRAGGIELESTVPVAGSAAVGDRVLLSIRPECIRLSKEPSPVNSFVVHVNSTSFLGEYCHHELGHGEHSLIAFELNGRPRDRPAGSQSWATVSPDDVVVLPGDKQP